jgi:hypothetical protein
MVSLQYGFGIAASQTHVAVTLAKRFELLDGKVPTTGVPRSPPLAAIVGFGLPDFLGIFLGPLLAASYYFVAIAFVVLTSGSAHTIIVLCCPTLRVLGYLFFVFFLILSACFDPMGQVRPGFLVLGVLFQAPPTIFSHARADTHLALIQVAVCRSRMFVIF